MLSRFLIVVLLLATGCATLPRPMVCPFALKEIRSVPGELIAFAPDGSFAVVRSVGERCDVRIVFRDPGRASIELPQAGYFNEPKISPDSRRVIYKSDDQSLTSFDAGTGRPQWTGPFRNVENFSPDGRLLACPDRDGFLVLDVNTGEVLLHLAAPESHNIDAVAFAPDGSKLAVERSGANALLMGYSSVDLIDLHTLVSVEVLSTSFGYQATDVTFSPDSKYLLIPTVHTGYWIHQFNTDGNLTVVATDDIRNRRTIGTTAGETVQIAGDRLLVSGPSGTIQVWNFPQLSESVTIPDGSDCRDDHPSLSPDGKYVVKTSPLRVYDTRTGGELIGAGDWQYIYRVIFSADGRFAATSGDTARIQAVNPR